MLFGWLTVDIDDRRLLAEDGHRPHPANDSAERHSRVSRRSPIAGTTAGASGSRRTACSTTCLGCVRSRFCSTTAAGCASARTSRKRWFARCQTRHARQAWHRRTSFRETPAGANRVRMIGIGLSVIVAAWIAWNFYAYSQAAVDRAVSSFTFRCRHGPARRRSSHWPTSRA